MSISNTFYTAVTGVNVWQICASAIAQQLFAMVWFGLIVKNVGEYYLAADKGVRKVEHMVHRYSVVACNIATFASAIIRAIAVAVIVSAFHGSAICDYQQAAIVVTVIACINQHHFFWCQRPLPLLLTECGYEVAASLIAGVTCFSMKRFGF